MLCDTAHAGRFKDFCARYIIADDSYDAAVGPIAELQAHYADNAAELRRALQRVYASELAKPAPNRRLLELLKHELEDDE
jgi:hypothetical protein